MRFPPFFSTALVAGTFCWCLPSLQAGPPADQKWEQPTWKVPKAQYDEIKAVDPAAGTLSIEHVGGTIKIHRDLKVNAFTTITVQDKKATLAELRPGMRVDYTLGSSDTLSRLVTVDPPPPPPTPVPTVPPSFPKGGQRP